MKPYRVLHSLLVAILALSLATVTIGCAEGGLDSNDEENVGDQDPDPSINTNQPDNQPDNQPEDPDRDPTIPDEGVAARGGLTPGASSASGESFSVSGQLSTVPPETVLKGETFEVRVRPVISF